MPRSAPGIGRRVEHLSSLWLMASQPSSSEESSQSNSPLQRRDWLMQRPRQVERPSYTNIFILKCTFVCVFVDKTLNACASIFTPRDKNAVTQSGGDVLSDRSLIELACFIAGEALATVIWHQTWRGCCWTPQRLPQCLNALCASKLRRLLHVSETELRQMKLPSLIYRFTKHS